MAPVSLSDQQLATVMEHARPLRHPEHRAKYLARVAELLRRHAGNIGDGLVSRVARQAQKEFLRPASGSKTIVGWR
jgi:hypothetical protein